MTSERSTIRLQLGQNKGWRRRVWHSLWSWLKLMRSLRAAENRSIGMEISPNVRCPFQTVEARMTVLRIKLGDELAVAVIGQRGNAFLRGHVDFAGLRPAGMRFGGIHVGEEIVFGRHELIPERRRLLIGELKQGDRLDALVAVLPGHGQAQRRAVLIGKNVAVAAHDQKRDFIRGLVQAQTLEVRPGVPGLLTLAGAFSGRRKLTMRTCLALAVGLAHSTNLAIGK